MTETTEYDFFVRDITGMVGLTEKDFEVFRKQQAFLVENAPVIVGFVASVLEKHPETRKVFDDGRGNLQRLGASLGNWLGMVVMQGHDTPDFWRRQFVIGLQHIQRRIPNRHMMILATRLREFLLPVLLDGLGTEDGMELYLAFQRFLDTIVALTATLVDEGQRRCLVTATGISGSLLDRLQESVFDQIAAELRYE